MLGKATKIADHLLKWEKEYAAVLRLGQSTDTQDATGTIIQETSTESVTEEQIHSALNEFRGDIQQVPPMYSAVKIKGQPLYKAARRGETIERSPRPVTIYRLEAGAIRGRDVELRVVCSKGTYIRTLCVDIGDRLQVGGHLLSLERSAVGSFHVQDAYELEDVKNAQCLSGNRRSFLTLDEALEQFPSVTVKPDYVARVMNGAPIPWNAINVSLSDDLLAGNSAHSRVRVKDPHGHLLALGKPHALANITTAGEIAVNIENVLIDK